MVIEQGVIDKIFKQKALVHLKKSSACANCKDRGSCDIAANQELFVEVVNELNAEVGDHVELMMPSSTLLKLSLLP